MVVKKTKLIFALTGTLFLSVFAPAAMAQEVKSDAISSSYNLSLTSDYRYRGISQTRLQPALQGGADLNQDISGLYSGTWLSTISWIKDTPSAGSTPLEWDVSAGKKGSLTVDISYDIGVLAYLYLNNHLDKAGMKNGNTLEAYGQLAYGSTTLKYSHALTPLFGIVASRSSSYLELSSNLEIMADFHLNLHAGYQKVTGINANLASYADYKIGVTKTFKELHEWQVSLAAVSTNAKKAFYTSPVRAQQLGKSSLILTVTRTF
ncbi:MAG: TorF family putative porin [Undibacterium sp.]|nr:TorF family putative porin [Undibacterium sp.]